MKNRVTFKSRGSTIVGNLYLPDGGEGSQPHPAILTAGPMATVKEQAAGVFAKSLAQQGFVTLAFDFTRFGESEGEPRQYEDPASKTEDLQNAISFLSTHENVDAQRIGALGICASSSYFAPLLASDRRARAFGTVSAHFSLREFFAANPMVTEEVLEHLLTASNAARQRYYETGMVEPDAMVWPDFTGEEEDQFSQDVYDYYFRRRDEWPNFSNHLVPFSLEQLVRSHALDYADQIVIPYLGIAGSEAITRPYTERFVEAKKRGSNEIQIIEGGYHVQAYDRPEYVGQAVEALTHFFQQHLAA